MLTYKIITNKATVYKLWLNSTMQIIILYSFLYKNVFLPFLLKVSKNAWAAGCVASKNFSTTPRKNAAGELKLLIKCCIINIIWIQKPNWHQVHCLLVNHTFDFLSHYWRWCSWSVFNLGGENSGSLFPIKSGRNRKSAVHWRWYCSCLWIEEYPSWRNGGILQWIKGMNHA